MGLLDPYAHPPSDPQKLAERRELLLDQLAWLMEEAAALAPLLAEMPEWAVSESALPGERSVRASLLRMAALDTGPRTEWIRGISATAGAAPALTVAEPEVPGDTDASVDVLLERVRAARAGLLELLAGVSEEAWLAPATLDDAPVTLYDIALRIAREDADELRALAYRLHEARLGGRGQ